LDQANDKLTELQNTIEQLTKIYASDRIVVLQAHAWRREMPKLSALQEDIKSVKCNLNILLGASNSYAAPLPPPFSERLKDPRDKHLVDVGHMLTWADITQVGICSAFDWISRIYPPLLPK
jgi:hypothetical protein